MSGSIKPPLRGLPFSSLTSGNSILATEYAFYHDRKAVMKFSSDTDHEKKLVSQILCCVTSSYTDTYDIFRAKNSKLNLLDRAYGRVGLCKWHDLLRDVDTRQSEH